MKILEKEKIENYINHAIDILFEQDAEILLENYKLNERAITHRLAMYIEPFFSSQGYKVDVEYNRMRLDYDNSNDVGDLMGKRLNWENSGEGSRYVYPDIIVHKRDLLENLIVVEVKMSWNNRKKELDYQKINEYIEQLDYEYGIYIELNEIRENCIVKFGPL
jgi:hypothetical protein